MKRITSFEVDHTKLERGLYISRQDGEITTYDIRMRKPNVEPVMENAAIHTIEHLFATFVRNSAYAQHVVYFGPMGCRTGFYFLTRALADDIAIALTKEAFSFIAQFSEAIPGTSPKECGNFRDHNLEGAKEEAKQMENILKNWDTMHLIYQK